MFARLFKEGECQEACGETFGFSNCELLVDIGQFKAGSVMASIWYDTESGTLTIFPTDEDLENDKSFKFKAFLTIEPTLDWTNAPG